MIDMEKNAYARHFSELVAWKKSRELAKEIFEASKMFPEDEKYSLTNQIRRSSRSVGAQIAEAWAKRRYEKHFVSKLTDADGEQNETQHWLIVALDAGYLERGAVCDYGTRCKEIGAMLGKMISIADQFCGDPGLTAPTKVRECDDTTEFFTLSSDLYPAPITDY
jgi:four helix bundle protein